MSIGIPRGQRDQTIDEIIGVLSPYQEQHPEAEINLYRQNSVSIRIRIVDPDFRQLPKAARHEAVWKYLDELSEDTQGDISMLLLITPEEKSTSFANFDFEDPLPSKL